MTASKLQLDRLTVSISVDDTPDASYLEQEGFEDRLEEYQRGEFHFVFLRAEATVSYEASPNFRRCETLPSGGLGGIESDSSSDYLASVAQEEIADLRCHLEAFGVVVTEEEWEERIAEAAANLML